EDERWLMRPEDFDHGGDDAERQTMFLAHELELAALQPGRMRDAQREEHGIAFDPPRVRDVLSHGFEAAAHELSAGIQGVVEVEDHSAHDSARNAQPFTGGATGPQ